MKRVFVALALVVLFAIPVWAQNAVYTRLGTAVTWLNTAGDEQLDLGDGVIGLTTAVGCGSYHDWGADPRPTRYYIEALIDGFDTAPVVGETADVYISMGQTTSVWTGPEVLADTTDSTGASARLKNLMYIGSLVVNTTTAGNNLVASFTVEVTARYWAPCVHNNTADSFLTTADAHSITVYPVYDEVQ